MLSATRLVLVAGLAVAPCGAAVADWERGKAALDAGDYVAAEVEFRAEVAARPGWAGGHYMLGETLRRARHFEEAVESLSKAVELEGANPTYCLGLGQGLVSATKFDEAVEVLGGLDPSTLEAGQRRTRVILLASAELSRDRHAAALAALEPELASGADDPSLQRLLGHSLAGVERRGEALTAFERAFELNPRDVGSARQAISLALGLAAEAGDNGARTALNRKAAGIAESLAGVETTSANFELAARCLLTAREAGRALPWVEKALAVRPDDPGLLYLAGWSLRCLGRTDDAARRLREALDHDPDPEQKRRIHDQLARIAEGRIELDQAIRQHQLAGDPDRARQLEEILAGVKSSVDRLSALRRQIDDVNARLAQLEALGQADAAAQVRAQVSVLEDEADAIEVNLSDVRQALRGSSDCG